MRASKRERHNELMTLIKENPFLKDDELSNIFGVSVSTIRFDRAELGILEYRERLKEAAQDSAGTANTDGELLDLNKFQNGISVLNTDDTMVFEGTDIVKSSYIYSFAENLALSVIDAHSMLVKVANIKYVSSVHSGEKLIAHSEVIREKDGAYIVHIFIKVKMREVFRGKFNFEVLN